MTHVTDNEEIESLRAQLAEVKKELKVLSDFCEGAEDRSLLHKGGLKCLVDAVQKQSDNYARALAAGSKRIAELHEMEQQLLATQAHAARLENALEIIAGRRQCIDNLLSNVDIANAAIFTHINLDALHEDRAEFIDSMVKHLLNEVCYNMGSGSPYRKMLHDYIDTLRKEAAAHRARKEQK